MLLVRRKFMAAHVAKNMANAPPDPEQWMRLDEADKLPV